MAFHDSDLDVLGHAVIPLPGGIYCNTGYIAGNIRVVNLCSSYLRLICDSCEESGGLVVPSAQWELAVRSGAASLDQINAIMYFALFLVGTHYGRPLAK